MICESHVAPCLQTASDLQTNLPARYQRVIEKLFFLPKGIDYAGNKEMEQTIVTGPGECLLPKGIGDDKNDALFDDRFF